MMQDIFLYCYFQIALRCTCNVSNAIFMNLDDHEKKCMKLAREIRTQGMLVMDCMRKTVTPSETTDLPGQSRSRWTTPNGFLSFEFRNVGHDCHIDLWWNTRAMRVFRKVNGDYGQSVDILKLAPLLLYLHHHPISWIFHKNDDFDIARGWHVCDDLWLMMKGCQLCINGTICETPEQCDRALDAVGTHRQ